MTSGWIPYSALVGSTVDTCCVSLQRLLGCFLLCEGGLGPCLSLCNDRCPWSLVLHAALVVDNGGTAGFAGSDAPRAVLAFPAVFP